MQIETIDYPTFTYLLKHHVIHETDPHTDIIYDILSHGSICNSDQMAILWLNLMRVTEICPNGKQYDMSKGCICKSLSGCKTSSYTQYKKKGHDHSIEGSFLSIHVFILAAVIAVLLYIIYYDSVQVIKRRCDQERIELLEKSITGTQLTVFQTCNREIRKTSLSKHTLPITTHNTRKHA